MSLKKTIRKYYPKAIVQGERPEVTAVRIIEDLQQYKMNTPAEIFQYNVLFAKSAMAYCYPNSTGIPEEQKNRMNEYFQEFLITGNLSNNPIDKLIEMLIEHRDGNIPKEQKILLAEYFSSLQKKGGEDE